MSENGTNGNGHNGNGKDTGLHSKTAGLKPWKKGQSGNPSGKRKGTVSIKAALLRNLTPALANKIAKTWLNAAANGDVGFSKIVIERLEGRVTEVVELSGPDGGSIPVNFYLPKKDEIPPELSELTDGR